MLLATLLCAAGVASAQDEDAGLAPAFSPPPITIGNLPTAPYVGAKACSTAGFALEFRLWFPANGHNAPWLQIWAGTACRGSARTAAGSGCKQVRVAPVASSDTLATQPVDLAKLDCPSHGTVTEKLWFLATEFEAPDAAERYSQEYDLTIDVDPPAAPTHTTLRLVGESLSPSWSYKDDSKHFVGVWDPAPTVPPGGAPTACTSDKLLAGASIDPLAPPVGLREFAFQLPSQTSADSMRTTDALGISFDTLALSTASRGALAVMAVDDAGNFSPLSNVACFAKPAPAVGTGCNVARGAPASGHCGWVFTLGVAAWRVRRRRTA